MSLLAGLLGFGAGAAKSLALTKEQDIAAQRQANLARLQAQYKTEAETKKLDQTTQLIGQARAGDVESQNRLRALDVSWQDEGAQIKAADLVNVVGRDGVERTVYVNTPGVMEKIESGEFVRVSTQTTSETWTTTITDLGNTIRTNSADPSKVEILIGNKWRPYTGERQEQQEANNRQQELSSGFTAEDYLNADITDSAGGIFDVLAPKIAGTPVVGELATAAIDENLGAEQRLSGRILQRLSNQILSEEAQKLLGDTESPRLTNLMLGLAEKAASLDMGFFSTPQSIANSVGAAQEVLQDELKRKRGLINNPNVSPEQRQAARNFVTTFDPVSKSFRNILDVHFIRNVTAPTANGQTKNLRDFTKEDLRNARKAVENGTIEYNPTQRQGLFRLARLYGI